MRGLDFLLGMGAVKEITTFGTAIVPARKDKADLTDADLNEIGKFLSEKLKTLDADENLTPDDLDLSHDVYELTIVPASCKIIIRR